MASGLVLTISLHSTEPTNVSMFLKMKQADLATSKGASILDDMQRNEITFEVLLSISSSFYEQLLRQYSCAKKITKPNCNKRKAAQRTFIQKGTSKMLMKFTPDGLH